MNKKDLESKILQIDAQLRAFGELSALIANGPAALSQVQQAQQSANTLIPQLTTQKGEIDTLKTTVESLLRSVEEKDSSVATLTENVEAMQTKVQDLIDKTTQQLARAADEKLANAFEGVKSKLEGEKWFWIYTILGTLFALLCAIGAVTAWQIKEFSTIYHWAFPARIALTSPLIFAVLFVTREYGRVRSLIEEYTFKGAIALNFAAYKEILDESFKNQVPDIQKEQLSFIIEAVRNLYSSPMRNIKMNRGKERGPTTEMVSNMLDQIRGFATTKE